MRIGIDCRALQEKFPSGVSFYAYHLLDALVRIPEMKEHTLVLFFNGFDIEKSPAIHELQKRWKDFPIEWRIHRIPNKVLTFLELSGRYPSVKWMFGNVDSVYVPNIQFFPWKEKKIPFIVTIHDLSFHRYPEFFHWKGRLRHLMIRPQKQAEKASAIVTVSTHSAYDIEKLYHIPKEKIEQITPGLDHHEMISDAKKREFSKKYILSIFTIEPRKNLTALLDAFENIQKNHPEMSLIVVGQNGWKAKKIITRMQKMNGVTYFGYVDEEKKKELLQNAYISIYPSFYEGFGFPPLEAQMAGVPVIVGNHSSLPEVLSNSALYIDVFDSSSLTRAIEHLLSDTALYHFLQEAGYQNVKRFSWETAAKKLFSLLHNQIKRVSS